MVTRETSKLKSTFRSECLLLNWNFFFELLCTKRGVLLKFVWHYIFLLLDAVFPCDKNEQRLRLNKAKLTKFQGFFLLCTLIIVILAASMSENDSNSLDLIFQNTFLYSLVFSGDPVIFKTLLMLY